MVTSITNLAPLNTSKRATNSLESIRQVPGNHLEALKADRKGQFSIRVNSQWRICFKWEDGNVYDVQLVDYH